MSLLAIDVGNENIVATVPRGRGIDVVTSETSHKQIPCVVSYQSERRFFADAAKQQKISNRQGCFYNIPIILGEKLDSEAVKRAQEVGIQYPLKAGQDGRAIASVYFGGEQQVLETTNMAAAMVNRVKHYATMMDNVNPADVVCVVPPRWPAYKRKAMLAAVESSGLKSLGIVNQNTAVGLGYYMRRINEFQNMPADNAGIKLAILSIGQIESWFSVMQMNKNGVQVLTHSGSLHIGACDFDKLLANMIVKQALQKCKMITADELQSKKTQIKIMKAAETAKKTLVINQKAPVTLECVGDN